MDAPTLFYLSKIANSYPGIAAAATNNDPNNSSNGNNLVPYDPSILNSMAEDYLRRIYTNSINFSLNNSILSPFSSGLNNSDLGVPQLAGGPLNNSLSSSSSPSSLSSSMSPSSSPNTSSNKNKNGQAPSASSSLSSSSSTSSSSASSLSSKKGNAINANPNNLLDPNAAANAAAVTMLALKTLSNQFNNYASGIPNSMVSGNSNNNGSKFLIADILGLSSNMCKNSSASSSNSSASLASPNSSSVSTSSPVSSLLATSNGQEQNYKSQNNSINFKKRPLNRQGSNSMPSYQSQINSQSLPNNSSSSKILNENNRQGSQALNFFNNSANHFNSSQSVSMLARPNAKNIFQQQLQNEDNSLHNGRNNANFFIQNRNQGISLSKFNSANNKMLNKKSNSFREDMNEEENSEFEDDQDLDSDQGSLNFLKFLF